MLLTLYKFTGKNIMVDKTNYLEPVRDLSNFTFRGSFNLISPVIIIEEDITSWDIDCNYCYIDGNRRYYYIINKERINNTLWELTLGIDVLYTYKDYIYNQTAYVTRNEFEFDDTIIDDLYPVTKDKEITILDLPNVENSYVNTEFNSGGLISWNTIIVSSDDSFRAQEDIICPIPNAVLPNINKLETFMLSNYHVISDTSSALMDYINDSAVSSFIKSIVIYPCSLPITGEGIPLVINDKPSDIDAYRPKYVPSCYMITNDFIVDIDYKFMNVEPFTTYELYIPFVGVVQINPHEILNKRLCLIYNPIFEDGSATVVLYNVTDNYIVYQSTCQLGISVGISYTNEREVANARTANTLNLITGTISAVTSKTAITPYQNFYGKNSMNRRADYLTNQSITGINNKAGFMSNMIGNISNYIINDIQNFIKGSAQVNNGVSGLFSPLKPYLKVTKAKTTGAYDSTFATLYGKPLNKIKTLSSLRGYTLIDNIQLTHISYASSDEMALILDSLKGGVIL